MIIGVGTDICSVTRIKDTLKRNGLAFAERVLTPEEQHEIPTLTPDFIAKRFAAKEAVAKALGCGIGSKISFQDIQITHTETGQPMVKLMPKVTNLFGHVRLHISISDEKEAYAVAMVIAERSDDDAAH
tara:strand:- start:202 stop:588 length:387 start_codon:yes stop_codon:yes gene_type:complete